MLYRTNLRYFDLSVDLQFDKGRLEDLEIADELVLLLGLPVDPVHLDAIRKQDIYELAINCSTSQFLNFSKI